MAEIGTVEFAYREYQHFMDGQVRRVVEKGETVSREKHEELIELAAEFNAISTDELRTYIAERGRESANQALAALGLGAFEEAPGDGAVAGKRHERRSA